MASVILCITLTNQFFVSLLKLLRCLLVKKNPNMAKLIYICIIWNGVHFSGPAKTLEHQGNPGQNWVHGHKQFE